MPLVGYLKKNNFWKVLKLAVHAWFRDNIITHSAALAYYTIFAMVPLTLVIIAVSSFFLEADVSRGEIHRTMTMMIGAEGADALNAFVQNSTFESPGLLTSIIGFVSLLFGATSMFSQLQDSLNYIWQVKPKPHAKVVYSFFQQRAISFSLVIFVGVLLLLSLILSTLLASFGKLFHFYLPGGSILWQGVEWVLFFFLSILLFAVIYKVLPDIDLTWENVWSGSSGDNNSFST
jgi:membrane protein